MKGDARKRARPGARQPGAGRRSDDAGTFAEDEWAADTAFAGVSDDDSAPDGGPIAADEPSAKRKQIVTFASLHQPGDAAYTPIALPPGTDVATASETTDSRVWQRAGACCCLQCELLRVVVGFSSSHSKVLLLADLDNTLWRDFVASGRGPLPAGVFVWGFYGAGFEQHVGSDPRRVCDAPPPNTPLAALSPRGSESLTHVATAGAAVDGQALRRVHFTPCGGGADAADAILVEACGVVCNLPTVIVSGDKGLIAAAEERRAAAIERRGGDSARLPPMVVVRALQPSGAKGGKGKEKEAVSVWAETVALCSKMLGLGGGDGSEGAEVRAGGEGGGAAACEGDGDPQPPVKSASGLKRKRKVVKRS